MDSRVYAEKLSRDAWLADRLRRRSFLGRADREVELGPETVDGWSYRIKGERWRPSLLDGHIVHNNKNWHLIRNPVAPLYECEDCGRLGTARRVCQRWLIARGPKRTDMFYFGDYGVLMICLACYNRKRAIIERLRKAWEVDSLISQLKRSIANERKKDRNDGRPPEVS